MTTDKLPFPPNLPPLPEPPAGHEWQYRGTGWMPDVKSTYIYLSLQEAFNHWMQFDDSFPQGRTGHYAEAVPIESPAEPDYQDPSYQKSILDAAWDGVPCQYFNPGNNCWIDEGDWHSVANSIAQGLRVRIKPAPYADLKAAHAQGKLIQMLYEGEWTTWLRPDWTRPPEEYRIKPKRIPLTAEDIPAVCWVRFRVESPNVLIHSIDSCGVSYAGKEREQEVTFQELMRDGWEYSEDRRNWKPCCKETEE